MKSMKRIVCTTLALVLIAAVMMAGLTVSAADNYTNYKQFKGSVGILSNCDKGDSAQKGKLDTFGQKLTFNVPSTEATQEQKDEVEGKAEAPWTEGRASENVSYSTDHYLQGNSGVKIHVTPDQKQSVGSQNKLWVTKTRFVIRNISGIKVTDKTKTYLCFYLYCKDLNTLKKINWGSSCIEISEKSDKDEYEFTMNAINEQNIDPATGKKVVLGPGWNRVCLPLTAGSGNKGKAATGTGAMDIKMFRFFLFADENMATNEDADVYFDNITLETADALGIKANTSSATPSKISVTSKTSSTSSTASTTGVPTTSSTIGETSSTAATTSEISSTTEDPAEVNESSDIPADAETEAEEESGSNWWVWVVVAVVLLAAVGAALYFLVFAKKKA